MNLTALIARLTELDARVEVDPFNRKLTEEWQQELVDNVPTLLEALKALEWMDKWGDSDGDPDTETQVFIKMKDGVTYYLKERKRPGKKAK